MRLPRAISMSLLLAGASAVSRSAAHAQVGHLPEQSPYDDVKLGQTVSFMAGWSAVKRDPAGVAPASSIAAVLRYDAAVGGPASLFVRYTLAPSSRNVLAPNQPRATRVARNQSVATHALEGGIDIALTGKKTWRSLMPLLSGGVGVVSDFAATDSGAYRFGTKFAFSYGLGLRYFPKRGPQLRLDVTNSIWQFQYPDRYFVLTSDTTSVLTNTNDRAAWRGTWGLSAGVTIPIFR